MASYNDIASAIMLMRQTTYTDPDWIERQISQTLRRRNYDRSWMQKISGRKAYSPKLARRVADAIRDTSLTEIGAVERYLTSVIGESRFCAAVYDVFERNGFASTGLPVRRVDNVRNERVLADALNIFVHGISNTQEILTEANAGNISGLYRIYRARSAGNTSIADKRALVLALDQRANVIHAVEISRAGQSVLARHGVFVASKFQSLLLLSASAAQSDAVSGLIRNLDDATLRGELTAVLSASTVSETTHETASYLLTRSAEGFDGWYIDGASGGRAAARRLAPRDTSLLDNLGPISDVNSPDISADDKALIRSLNLASPAQAGGVEQITPAGL